VASKSIAAGMLKQKDMTQKELGKVIKKASEHKLVERKKKSNALL
jgi:hypothetical protein